MKNKPVATISILILTVLITWIAPIFDSSLYGVNGHPTEWLSFYPAHPLNHFGAGLFASPFLHLNGQHLFTNLILFFPLAMVIERKESALFLLKFFILFHFQILLMLICLNEVIPLEGKYFLGSSHIILAFYSFWGLSQKKWFLLGFSLLALMIGYWQGQSHLTTWAHAIGIFVGIETLFLSSFWNKIRPKRSH
ncbi:MAG: hypothetical protein AB7I27_07895 [Bacteriovoracaceae bacterium]